MKTPTSMAMTASVTPTTKYASILPSTISAGRSGVESNLLHGADLPFARDGERGEQGGDDHQDDGDQAGHDVVLGFERAVVPDAHARINGRDGRGAAAAPVLRCRAEFERVGLHDGFGIAKRDGGGVGIAAIEQELHVRFAGRRPSLRE